MQTHDAATAPYDPASSLPPAPVAPAKDAAPKTRPSRVTAPPAPSHRHKLPLKRDGTVSIFLMYYECITNVFKPNKTQMKIVAGWKGKCNACKAAKSTFIY